MMPSQYRYKLRDLVISMKDGQSFRTRDLNTAIGFGRAADKLGYRVVRRRIKPGLYRVWLFHDKLVKLIPNWGVNIDNLPIPVPKANY